MVYSFIIRGGQGWSQGGCDTLSGGTTQLLSGEQSIQNSDDIVASGATVKQVQHLALGDTSLLGKLAPLVVGQGGLGVVVGVGHVGFSLWFTLVVWHVMDPSARGVVPVCGLAQGGQ